MAGAAALDIHSKEWNGAKKNPITSTFIYTYLTLSMTCVRGTTSRRWREREREKSNRCLSASLSIGSLLSKRLWLTSIREGERENVFVCLHDLLVTCNLKRAERRAAIRAVKRKEKKQKIGRLDKRRENAGNNERGNAGKSHAKCNQALPKRGNGMR